MIFGESTFVVLDKINLMLLIIDIDNYILKIKTVKVIKSNLIILIKNQTEVISMENNIPKPVGSAVIRYSGLIFDIIQQDMQIGNKIKIFELARRSPGVRVIIVDGNKMLVTKEYRTEIKGWDFRLPGGKVFDSLEEYRTAADSGKDMEDFARDAAKKEALEETGIVIDDIKYFATSGTGGPTVLWDMYYFVADKFHLSDSGQMLEPGENITYEWMNFYDVKKLCLDGSFKEDRTVANILRFLYHG